MVSVIIPIYNVERYLKQCLKSVLNQTYKDMEIILVNDASPDGSLTICKQFAELDPRITIIDKKVNEGVDMARFSGLDAAKGEYIYFIDPDDWLARRDIIELMVNKADETGVDYVLMNYQKVIGRHALIKTKYKLPEEGLITQPKLQDKYYIGFYGWSQISPNVWDKLYRRSFLKRTGINPSGLRFGQDYAFNMRIFPYLKSIYVLDVCGYCYREGGLTAKNHTKHLNTRKELFRLMMAESAKHNFPQGIKQGIAHFIAIFESDVISIAARNPHNEACEIIKNEFKDDFWRLVLRSNQYPELFNTAFSKALLSKNVNLILSLTNKEVPRRKLHFRLRKLANTLLKHL